MGPYAKAYYSAVILANDMKHIHTHAKGLLFDTIHSVCNEYYEKASNDADTLVELALEKNEPILNPSLAATMIDYKPANFNAYDIENAMYTAKGSILMFLKALVELRKETDDVSVQSLLDDMMRYWKKEKDYKIKARLADWE